MDASTPVATLLDERESGSHEDLYNSSLQANQLQDHRALPLRFYLIGGLIYNCAMTAALGGASWALLSFMLSP